MTLLALKKVDIEAALDFVLNENESDIGED